MKNKIVKITLIFFIAGTLGIKAQSFTKGQKDLNIGIGLGNNIVNAGMGSTFPPVSASLEFGVTNAISIGGYIGYTGAKWSYTGTESYNGAFYPFTDEYSWSYYIIGVRGAYHFAQFIKNDKVDLYAGLMLGDDIVKEKYSTTAHEPGHSSVAQSSGGFLFSAFAGCRYRFNEHFGAFAELGFGVTNLNLGLNYKF